MTTHCVHLDAEQHTADMYMLCGVHNKLEDCNEAVPETKKVADFLAGISCPLLQMGLNIVMSDPMKLSNFDVTQQFLGTLVAYQANTAP